MTKIVSLVDGNITEEGCSNCKARYFMGDRLVGKKCWKCEERITSYNPEESLYFDKETRTWRKDEEENTI